MSLKLIHSVSDREHGIQEALNIVRDLKQYYLERPAKPEEEKIKWLRFGRALGAKAVEDELTTLLEKAREEDRIKNEKVNRS
jgi:hypothetical protein